MFVQSPLGSSRPTALVSRDLSEVMDWCTTVESPPRKPTMEVLSRGPMSFTKLRIEAFAFSMRSLTFIEPLSSTTITTETPVTLSMLVTSGLMGVPSCVSVKSSETRP